MKKKQSNDEKIIGALDAIDKSTRNLENFAKQYDRHIDQAALRNDKNRVTKLIRQKIAVYALINQLQTLKGNIELGAYTAKAISDMGKLPAAIAGCKGLLSESPNFSALGKSIKKVFKDMDISTNQLEELNNILDNVLTPQTESSLDTYSNANGNYANDEQFQTEYAAMLERIKDNPEVGRETITRPAVDGNYATGTMDFDRIIADENNKK